MNPREGEIAGFARPAGSRSTAIEAAAVGVVAVLVLALRAPFAISRLWAEDGTVFLQEAVNGGIARSFGHPYEGYYHFVPRVIAALTSAVPVRDAAFTTWLCVALVVGWCAATIYVESRTELATRPSRALLGLSIVLLPAVGLEALGSSADLQYTLLFTALVALTGMSTARSSQINRAAIVTVTALTTPLVLVLAPIALMRVIRSRPRRVDSTLIVWGVATAVQLGTILVERPKRNIGSPSGGPLLSRFDHRVLFTNLLPKQIAGSFLAPVALLIGAGLVLFAAWRAWQRPRHARATLLLLVPAIGLAFWIFAGKHYGLPARYRVFPALCVIWCVLVAWEELMRALRPAVDAVDWRAASVLVVVLALVWLTYWTPAASRSSGPKWTVALTNAEKRCKNLKLPTVALRVPPVAKGAGVWTVRLPCSDVT